jgi:hypothetical protein
MKARFAKKEVEEIDAILPFMSLLIIIIPLLLSNLAFYHFKVIETSFPGASDPSTSDATPTPNKDKLVMAQLLIESDKAVLKILDESNGSTIKEQKESSDKKGAISLFEILKSFKKEYPKLDTILVTTQAEVKYDSLIQVLDPFKSPILGIATEVAREVAQGKEEEGFKCLQLKKKRFKA